MISAVKNNNAGERIDGGVGWSGECVDDFR